MALSEEPEDAGAPGTGEPGDAAAAVRPSMRPALPVFDDDARSPDPSVCPFLRRDTGDALVAPVSTPGDDQACVAIGSARPQSLRQQELVCLRVAHADCPRYLRGSMAAGSVSPARSVPTVPRATLAALLILVLSAGISFGFVVQRGGIAMPVVGGESPVAAVATPTSQPTDPPAPTGAGPSVPVEPTASIAVDPTPSAIPTPTPTAVPTLVPTAVPTPTATPAATPAPTPTPAATTKPKGDRYKLLEPCPDRADCWIYTVRSGDNLYSIANYFGHPLSTIYEWNPQYPDKRLRVGAEIRMPPPTR